MESRTKRRLSRDQIVAATARAFGPGTTVAAADEIADGMFNAVYRIQLEGGPTVVMKSSPPADVPLLTYERDILRTEATFYDLAATLPNLPMPRVLARDFSRRHLDGDLIFCSHLDGQGWHRLHDQLTPDDERRLRRDLGALVAALHHQTGVEFGYFQNGAARAMTWREAFFAMVDDVLADAARFDVRLPAEPATILAALRAHAHLLDAVTKPSLVHFDLWEGNILLAERDGRLEISGVIDGERAMWADPVADFVSLALFSDVADDIDLLAGYGGAKPFAVTPEIRARVAMYKTYLDLIMVVEAAPRGYDPSGDHAAVLRAAIDDVRASLALLGIAAESDA